jgi:glycosyltransferase involved in cell wall biosynthesis
MRVYVDHTHVWRHVTGIERITLQLFSKDALKPLDVVPIHARRMKEMLFKQTFYLPACLARSQSSVLLCPGFPATPLLQLFRGRVIPYIHDVFLLSRRDDLNWRAKAYSAWPFGLAVRHFPRFLVNTADTATKLRRFCKEDAKITIYRPPATNSFELNVGDRAQRPSQLRRLRLAALGTVEPRKNFIAAARILAALRDQGLVDATLEIIGRRGWGDDWAKLQKMPGVILHGYKSDREVQQILDGADALICTSHEEGLGLPLLEAQFTGIPIIAPNQSVFREVLGQSGVFVDPHDPRAAAEVIAAIIAVDGWRSAYIARDNANLQRWNRMAASDHERVIDLLCRLGTHIDYRHRRIHFANFGKAHGRH